MAMIVFNPCPACHGEGAIITGQAWDGTDDGYLCPTCNGACVVEEEIEPRTLMDLEQEDYDMLEAKCR
jgi:DnaJ-class molecular chaperone